MALFKSPRGTLGAIICLGAILRFIFIITTSHELVSDESEYWDLASSISETGSYTIHGTPTAFRPVGYPLLLAGVQVIFGPSIIAARIIQVLLDLGTMLGLAFIIRRAGYRNHNLVAMIWAVFPPAILYCGLILSETLSVFLLVYSFAVLLHPEWVRQRGPMFVGGILIGLLTLVKPWCLLFGAATAVFLFFQRNPLKPILLFISGITLCALPWMVRNAVVADRFSLSTNTGINLLIGNNPISTGAYTTRLPDSIFVLPANEKEFDQISTTTAFQYIVDHPMIFLARAGIKLAHVFRSEGELLVWAFHPDMRSSKSRFAEKYRSIPFITTILVNSGYFLVLMAGFLGFVYFWPDKFTMFHLLFSLVLLGVHAVFFGGSRFHFLLMPLCAVTAAGVVPLRSSAWGGLSPVKKVLFLVVIALLITLWVYEFLYVY